MLDAKTTVGWNFFAAENELEIGFEGRVRKRSNFEWLRAWVGKVPGGSRSGLARFGIPSAGPVLDMIFQNSTGRFLIKSSVRPNPKKGKNGRQRLGRNRVCSSPKHGERRHLLLQKVWRKCWVSILNIENLYNVEIILPVSGNFFLIIFKFKIKIY